MDAKTEADYQYNRAFKMAQQAFPTSTHFEEVTRKATEAEVQIQLQFAQVSAIREQTVELRRIADALERRDVVGLEWLLEDDDINARLAAGWVYLGETCVPHETEKMPRAILGRPRNVPKGAKGGGEGG